MKNYLLYNVDDQADNRFLLYHIFKSHLSRYTLRLFGSGQELFEHLAATQERPGLILLDLHMPELDGLQTLTLLKKHPEWKIIPVVMWTSSEDKDYIDQSYQAGVDSYMVKPTHPDEFKEMLEKICQYWFEVARPQGIAY